MRLRSIKLAVGTVGLLACLVGVTACGGGSPPSETPTVTETGTTAAPEVTTPDAGEQGKLPNMVGMDLQLAQDTSQAAGFYGLASTDATGAGRLQVIDRNWVVCSQDPAAGQHPTNTTVTFSVVKDDESCP
ncbi:PASTA domain-containing protein [Streptomyces sp. NPDC051742]|uniref:PASTA domain-containing protein n=1 Tax=unclassified Streptomyces TaxID=2593676 RepID=UPI00341CADB8